MTLPAGTSPQSYWKLQDGDWYELTGASVAGDAVTFTLTDGGTGDGDHEANGTIVDPGGPAVVGTPEPTPIPTPTDVTPTFTG